MSSSTPLRLAAWAGIALTALTSAFADGPDAGALDPASQIDAARAARVATNYVLSYQATAAVAVETGQAVCDSHGDAPLYYCFDLLPCGYVVVSGSAKLPPVVAYSFGDPAGAADDPANPLHDLLRRDLAARLDALELLSPDMRMQRRAAWDQLTAGPLPEGERDRQQWPPAGSTTTGGWVLTRWTQNAPYYNHCPMDPVTGQRSLAGCPAVAMAQIVNYNRRLNGTRFDNSDDYYHSYAGRNYWIDNDYVARGFPSFPQLDTYLDGLFNKYFYGNALSNTDMAALVFACGVAAQQVYASNGSGTFGVSQAMDAYRRFGCDTAELLYESSPGPYPRLAQNMMDGHPAHLAIVNAGWTSGHNLVVDGYNTNQYYHLNFGWGGSYDGWYLLPSELPMSLTVVEGIIVDILTDKCQPMDCDGDSGVDWLDFTYFAGCMTGPAGTLGPPGCLSFEGDGDQDVDLADFDVFQRSFSG